MYIILYNLTSVTQSALVSSRAQIFTLVCDPQVRALHLAAAVKLSSINQIRTSLFAPCLGLCPLSRRRLCRKAGNHLTSFYCIFCCLGNQLEKSAAIDSPHAPLTKPHPSFLQLLTTQTDSPRLIQVIFLQGGRTV